MIGLPNMIANDQATGLQNSVREGDGQYAANAYGAAWATAATIAADLLALHPVPVSGDTAVLFNSSDTSYRAYFYANAGWHYVALT